MSDLSPSRTETWAPHPAAAPRCRRDGDTLIAAANGTRTCVGGWQTHYLGTVEGQTYRVVVDCEHDGVADPRDMLRIMACWGDASADSARTGYLPQLNLLPQYLAPGRTCFALDTTAPPGADHLTLRMTLRWTTAGEVRWQPAQIATVTPATGPAAHRVAVVTGHQQARRGPWTVARNVAFYTELCDRACAADADLDLLLLPEVALQWQREGDAVRNTCLLIAPDGALDGRYWKVHLASGGEDVSGILPGDAFPVYGTEMGRVGCNICMDSSAAESSRMVGLNGADWLLLPIMGDHRADRWSAGNPIYSESRWLAIMRTRAMDNQLTMVVARNTSHGSCVIDRKGEVLAWNEGDRDHIVAEVVRDDGYRTWNGGCFRDVNWMQRRPHTYAAFGAPDCFGGLSTTTDSATEADS